MRKLLPRRRRWALRAGLRVVLGFTLVAVTTGACGFFYARPQVGEFFAVQLRERFAEEGVFLDWESADWVPGAGIRLHGLTVHRDAARRDRLALVDSVTATKGYPSWPQWDKVIFTAADTAVVVGTGASETNFAHAELQLFIEPGRTDL